MPLIAMLLMACQVARPVPVKGNSPVSPMVPKEPPRPAMVANIAPRGAIPADFRGDPTSQVPLLESRAGKELGFWASLPTSSVKRDWNEFWWRQLEFRRDLALWGWASFGDPASLYLERVKDSVLASQPELRRRLRVYACPSPYVNAMVLPDGVVLVNAGLLARLVDESQLAFVIAHEAAHYALKHAEETWWEVRDSKSDASSDRWERTRFRHSREREAQADSIGAQYLLASRYAHARVDSLLGILGGSDNPCGSRAWTRDALAGFPDLQWGDSIWMDPAKAILSPPETEDSDSLATHPAIPKRRTAAKRFFGADRTARQFALVGGDAFVQVRESARHAVPRGWLEANQPAAALFESWSLLETSSGDTSLARSFDQALVDLALDRGATRRSAPRAARVRIWGAYQTLDHFLREIDSPRLFALAILAARKERLVAPHDTARSEMELELLEEFEKSQPLHLQYLRDTSRIARSLRGQKAILDRIRQVVPELALPGQLVRIAPPDTGVVAWGGTAFLAGVDWGDRPLAKSVGGLDKGRAIVRGALERAFRDKGVRIISSDPSSWTGDSLDALHASRRLLDWAMNRLDSRGVPRYRPGLAQLRADLRRWSADKVLLVSLDLGPSEREFDRSLSPHRVAWLSSPRRVWFAPQTYLMGVVFDSRTGGVCAIARTNLWDPPSEETIATASRKLVGELMAKTRN